MHTTMQLLAPPPHTARTASTPSVVGLNVRVCKRFRGYGDAEPLFFGTIVSCQTERGRCRIAWDDGSHSSLAAHTVRALIVDERRENLLKRV